MILPRSSGRNAQVPLGAAYLAAALERQGFEVSILDAICEGFERVRPERGGRYSYGLEVGEIISRVLKDSPDVVGVSCTSSLQYGYARSIAEGFRRQGPAPLLAIGGAHASALPEEVVGKGPFDLAVIGEAEETFPEALKLIEQGDLDDLRAIPGLCFEGIEGLVRTRGVGVVENLDSLPLPARHLLPMDRYAQLEAWHDATVKNRPATQLITSRGCPAKCSFCSVHNTMGGRYRGRSVDSVIAELMELRDRWGIREVQFEDDNLTLDRRRSRKLFQAMTDAKLGLTWSTPNGIAMWTLEPDMIDIMALAGCHKLNFAIESGVQRVLDEVIRKPLRLENVPALLDRARKNGITVHTFFVVGFPGETRAEMVKTFSFARKLGGDSANFFIATPYPGTPLYEECLEKGLLAKDFSFEGLDVTEGVIEHPEISAAELTAWVAREDAAMRLRRMLRPTNLHRAVRRILRDPRRLTGYAGSLVRRTVAGFRR
jgi:radical SAM superfamily enzyme YgiQ (UPF0313 family)